MEPELTPMPKFDAKEHLEFIKNMAVEEFAKEGSVNPHAVIITRMNLDTKEMGNDINVVYMPVGEFMKSPETKDQLSIMLKALIEETKATCMALVSEAWYLALPKDENKSAEESRAEVNNISVSKHPERKECVMINFETDVSCSVTVMEIVRDGDKAHIDKDKSQTNEMAVGRFANLLKKNTISN